MSDENPNQFEEETVEQEVQTEVAEAAPVYANGNGSVTHTPQVQPQNPGLMADIKFKVPASQFLGRGANNLMGATDTRKPYAKELVRTGNDRQFIDELMFKPEAGDYQFAVQRYLPVHWEGEQVKTGRIDSLPLMQYDCVSDEISRKWGGGKYKLVVVDMHGRIVDSISRGVLVDIPTTLYAPCSEPYANEVLPQKPQTAVANDDTDDEKERDRQHKAELKEFERQKRRRAEEMRRQKEELRMAEEEQELRRRSKAINGGDEDSEMKALILKLEADRVKAEADRKEELRQIEDRREKEAKRIEDQQREDRKMFMDGLAKMGESIAKVAEIAAKPKEDNGNKEMFQMMLAQQAQQAQQAAAAQQSTTAILTALISKEPPQLPAPVDNMPLITAMMDSNSKTMTALLQRPQEDKGATMLDAMVKIAQMTKKDDTLQNQLIQGLLTKKDEGVGIEEMMALIKLGEDRSDKMFARIQEITGAITPATEGEIQEDGYDPKLGFLGNAGKSLFGGLKSVVEMAATNPQVQELLVKLVGSRTPSQNELAMAAMRMENQFTSPPMLQQPQYQAPPQQRPAFRGPYAQPIPPPLMPQDVATYNAMTQQQNPQQSPQQYAIPPQQHLQGRQPTDPNRVDVVAPNSSGLPPMNQGQRPPPPPQTQQQAVVNEMEGVSGGMTLPSNGDPEPDALPSNEEIARQAQSETVTATMAIALEEMITKPAVRTWAEHAHDTWPKALKDAIVAAATMQEKVKLITENCGEDVWLRLMQKFEQEEQTADRGKEQMQFATQILRLCEVNKPGAPTNG